MNEPSSSPLRAARIGIAVTVIVTLNLAFSASRTLTGTVKDADGKPVANVPVKLFVKGKSIGPTPILPGGSPTGDSIVGGEPAVPLGPGLRPIQETSTDASGKFAFQNVTPNVYEIVATRRNKTARLTVNVKENVEIPALSLTLPK
jgi:hypothetical protein